MRLVGSDKGLKEIQINEGSVASRQKDGTFHVSGEAAKTLLKTGDFAVAGTTFRGGTGWVCQECRFVGLFKDKCGRCGSVDLLQEEN